MKDFEQWELDFIKENYMNMTDGEIGDKLNTTFHAIGRKRRSMGLVKEKTHPQKEAIINDYLSGMKMKDLKIKYNKTSSNLINLLQGYGVYICTSTKWTKGEINTLRNIYSTNAWEYILSEIPNHSKDDIVCKASKLKIKKEDYYWNEQDIDILKDEYIKGTSIKNIVVLLNNKFTYGAIVSKANNLNIKQTYKWENWEIEYLNNNYSIMTMDDICKVLTNRNRRSIAMKAMELGLKYIAFYKDYEIDFIKQNYNNMTDKEISEQLSNRNWHSVLDKRLALGLKKQKKGIYESLDNYLRKQITQWKKDSMEYCNYKCVLTNERFNDIHHLYGMNYIIKEMFKNTNIEIKNSFEEYSEMELKIIKDTFLEIHNKYPLGVCLRRDVHELFHLIYGFGNNTPEQFEEFKQRYQSGEFSDLLTA